LLRAPGDASGSGPRRREAVQAEAGRDHRQSSWLPGCVGAHAAFSKLFLAPGKIENTAVFWQLIDRGEDGWAEQLGIKAVEIAQDEIAVDHAGYVWLRLIHDCGLGLNNGNACRVILVQTSAGRGHGT